MATNDGMLKRLAIQWFGRFTWGELKKFLLLGGIFSFTIGIYWAMRIAKDSVFLNLVGADYQPWAKWLSLGVVIPLVLVYGMLVDMFPRHRVFYILSLIYGSLALVFAMLLNHPEIGMANAVASPTRIMPWLFYVMVESYGSLMVALFWAFAADTTSPDSAKRGFYLVALFAQIGALIGSFIQWQFAESAGTGAIVAVAGVATLSIIAWIRLFMAVVPQEELQSYQEKKIEKEEKKKPKVSIGEGLRLFISQPYLLGIFGVITIFEIVATLFDFRFKMLASQVYTKDQLTRYLGEYGIWVSLVALVSLLSGIGNIGRRLGLKVTLATLPVLIAIFAAVSYMSATVDIVLAVRVSLIVLVLSKALNYALNQPAKEQLYIPTSRDAKYKSKAFMEMFGSRSSKAFGSGINMLKKFMTPDAFGLFSLVASLGLCGIWFAVALGLGRVHKQAVENNEVVC